MDFLFTITGFLKENKTKQNKTKQTNKTKQNKKKRVTESNIQRTAEV